MIPLRRILLPLGAALLVGATLLSIVLLFNSPKITEIAPSASGHTIQGHVRKPAGYALAAFAYAGDRWTPVQNTPIPIAAGGDFHIQIHAVDNRAPEQILVYLVPADTPLVTLDAQTRAQSVSVHQRLIDPYAYDLRAEEAVAAMNAAKPAESMPDSRPSTALDPPAATASPTAAATTTAEPIATPTPILPRLDSVAYTQKHTVTGRVVAADPTAYRVILCIYTDQYYAKPRFQDGEGLELVQPDADGAFEIEAFHPDAFETDIAATEYLVVLVPDTFPGLSEIYRIQEALDVKVDAFYGDVPR